MERRSRRSSSAKDGSNAADKSAEGDTSVVEQLSVERDSTKTILEDVCMDFESMDVINPKSNKVSGVKKEKDSTVAEKKDPKEDSSAATIEVVPSISNKSSVNEDQDFSDKGRELPCIDENNETNSQFTITSIPSEPVQACDAPVLRCEIQADTDTMPSNNSQNSSDIPVLVQEDFIDETNIPLAELADAEIVQSGDKVSIIVTNSRLIKVLTQAGNSDNSVQSVIEPTNIILETNVGSSNSLGILDPDILLDSNINDIMADSSVVNETVISDDVIEHEPQLTKNQLNISLKKSPNARGKLAMKKVSKQSFSEPSAFTKARRVTAKMKNEWARQLEADGHLVCQMPGCLQTYVTVANFQTHYKYCTGKKRLQHCLYCDSLIFSSHRAVLHHMQVEHPEKVEEYKAKYPEAANELEEEDGLPSHLIVAEDENVAINEEVTHQPFKNARKRKLSSKENVVSKKRCILKHKIQTIQNKVTENIKEFKKCVRFTDIVEKINSVDVANSLELPSSPQKKVLSKPKKEKKRERILLTETIVAEEKYFEDDEDDPTSIPREQNDEIPENTKARVLLNMERYKRYKEYLKLTRDWSSERRTYSRSRSAETSFDSSYLMALQNEYMQDTLQLTESVELSSISLNTSEAEVNQQEPDLEIFEPDPMPTPVVTPQDVIVNESIIAAVCRVPGRNFEVPSKYPSRLAIETQKSASSSQIPNSATPSITPERNYSYTRVVRGEKTPCYNRPNLPVEPNNISVVPPVPIKIEGVKSKPRHDSAITFGVNAPSKGNKPVEPPVSFDSLITPTQQKQEKMSTSAKGADVQIDLQNSSQKEAVKDGVTVGDSDSPKKKRGRPPKIKIEKAEQVKGANEPQNKINPNLERKNAKMYGKAMLKSIETNVKNRHSKLFKKNSKYKKNSKLQQKQHLHLRNLKTIQKNKLKQKMLAKSKSNEKNAKNSFIAVNTIISNQEKLSKANPTTESSITEHSYSNIINSVIEDQLIADANNVATEIEIVTSSVENNAAPYDINTFEVNEKAEKVSSQIALAESSEDHIKESLENVLPTAESTPKSHNLGHSEVNDGVENNAETAPVSPEKINSEDSLNIENVDLEAILNDENNAAPQQTEISESNLSIEITTPEVKVKRGRGRPRKNQSNTQTPDTPVASNSVSNVSRTEEKDKAKTVDEDRDATSESETPVPVRKSERVKRRKVADDEMFQTPKVEAKKKEEEEPVQVIRTGRRGRPRKVVVNEFEANREEEKVDESIENTPEVESGLADESLRKFSRKGRPRKCVRYADLNSGMESSESLDGMNASAKSKAEVSKKQEKNKKSKELEEKDDDAENNTAEEMEETIVLPLKKRKQKQAKKDDSGLKKTDEKSKDADSEILLEEEEEKEEIELESEKEEEEPKSAKGSRKRKRVRHDSSDMEAELESLISSSKKRQNYSAPVTRRKATAVEVEETSDAEKNYDGVSNQKDSSKKLIDSPPINRKYSARSIARSKALKCAALNYSLESSVVVLPGFKPLKEAWKLLSGKNFYDFLPPLKFSPFFKTEKTWKESGSDWSSLRVFDSASLDKESCHMTFFTGGPVMSSAWCPTPVENKNVQYIALAISCSLDKLHPFSSTDSNRGLLQLWSVGLLRDKIPESKPTLELCIAHEHGIVTEMAWCPHGCWEDPSSVSSEDHFPRLGLLATACSDSFVRIYSIPQPSALNTDSSFPMYESHPTVVLEPLFGETCYATKKSVCLSLSWQRHDHCERIAGGYGNGMICVWHINTSATILVSKERNPIKIRPYLVFNAHGTPVTSVSFAPIPGSRFLVSSSIDRTLKFWDLVDSSLPFFTIKKGAARCAEWSAHYCGAFVSLDYGMNCFKGSSYFKECGIEIYSPRNLSPPSISVTRTTMSEFLNAQAITEIAGSVSVSFIHSLLQEHVRSPPYFHRPVYLTKIAEVEGIDEKVTSLSYPESVTCMDTIQEMKEVVCIINKITQKDFTPEPQEINSVESSEDSSQWPDCESTMQRMKDTVSAVTDLVEKCANSVQLDQNLVTSDDPELECTKVSCRSEVEDLVILNDKLSEMKDLVAAVMDINDVASTVDQLSLNSEEIISASEKMPNLKAVADNSLSVSMMEVDEESEINQSRENIQGTPENVLNSSQDSVKDLCSESVACICTLHENVACISALHDNVACISTLEEMGAVVAVVKDITDRCPKVETLDVCSDTLEAATCENSETDSKQQIKDLEMAFVNNVEKDSSVVIVDSVMQRMKEVVSVVAHVIERSSNELNEFEMKILVTEYLTELFKKQKLLNVDEEISNGKWLIQGTGLPFDFSGLTDIVGTVMDLRDVTLTIEQLVSNGQGMDSFGNQVPSYLAELIYGNIKSQPKSFVGIQTDSAAEVTDFPSPKSTLSSDVCDEIAVQLETATALHEAVGTVCEKLETEAEIKNLLKDVVSEVEVKNLLSEMVSEAEVESLLCEMVSEIQKVELECDEKKPNLLLFAAEDVSSSKCLFIAGNDEDLPMTDEPIFLDVFSGSAVSDETKELCNNAVPPSENVDSMQPLKLEEDELMLLDGESSNSENESDSDDEMEVADSYIFEEKTVFSDDSFMSECSLDSNISMCSYSGLSDISENSYDAGPNEQNSVKPTLCSDVQSNVGNESQMPVESSHSPLKVVPDCLQDSSSYHAKDSFKNDSEITSSHQEGQEAEIHPVQTEINLTEEIVPTSSCQETDIQRGNQKSMSDEIYVSDNLGISVNDVVVDGITSKIVCNVSDQSEVEVVPLSNKDSLADIPQTNGILTDDIICDKISRTESSEKPIDISCTENSEEGSPVCSDNSLKITPDSDCSALPETMQKDIFDREKVPQTVVNNDSNEDSIFLESIPVVHKKTSSSERMSYENVISQYGLVFKDMNTARFESIEDIQTEGEDSLDQYHLASIKTISWNPNFGTHYWLFSAGQSGLARISYISDINESEVSKTKDGRDT